jgi:thiamine kinase-like enzyme
LRAYHDVVSTFVPSSDARWRLDGQSWKPGDIIGHNDAAPYNAVWDLSSDSLVGIIDWDFAAPCQAIYDLAFVASAWVPLHSRSDAIEQGFTDFDDRGRRLRLLLEAYGSEATIPELIDVIHVCMADHIDSIRAIADSGDPFFVKLVEIGAIENIQRARTELSEDAATFLSA